MPQYNPDKYPDDVEESYWTQTFTVYRIHSFQDGSAKVNWMSNDDNDDGYADEKLISEEYRFKTLAKAIEFSGRSRIGLYGQPVDVFLDGEQI